MDIHSGAAIGREELLGQAGGGAPATGGVSGGVSGGMIVAGAGLIASYAASQAQLAAGIQQQTGYLLQARDNLAVAEVRAEMSDQYAQIQAGRMLKKAQVEAQNYQIAGNQLLKNLRATNATARARAAASGVAFGEGSAAAIQRENVQATMFDVGIADLNALTARVLGFEDAAAMIQSTDYQNFLNVFAAQRQAGQFTQAGKAARQQAGLLAGATLTRGAIEFAQTGYRS